MTGPQRARGPRRASERPRAGDACCWLHSRRWRNVSVCASGNRLRSKGSTTEGGDLDDTDAITRALETLNRLVVDQESLDARLKRVAAVTCSTVSGCDM